MSFAENQSLMRSKKFELIFFFKEKITIFENFYGVVTNVYIFAKTSVFWANIMRQITIKMHSKIYQINHYSKMPYGSNIYII